MFWQNFTRLCKEAGKPPTRVAADLGLSNAAAVGWKKGAVPRDRTIKQIADYFGVPVDALTADDAPKAPAFPAPLESELLDYYRGFTREGQGRLLDFAAAMKRSGMYEPGVDYFLQAFNKGFDADGADAYGQ